MLQKPPSAKCPTTVGVFCRARGFAALSKHSFSWAKVIMLRSFPKSKITTIIRLSTWPSSSEEHRWQLLFQTLFIFPNFFPHYHNYYYYFKQYYKPDGDVGQKVQYTVCWSSTKITVVSVSERSGTLWSDFARPQRHLTLANVFRKCWPRREGVGEMKALIEQSEVLGNAKQHR